MENDKNSLDGLKRIIRGILNEESTILAGKHWYHGSNKPVSKFRYDLVGVNSERISNYHGFGIYFLSDIERAKKYGDIIIEIQVSENSNLMVNMPTKNQLESIYHQMVKEDFEMRPNDEEWFLNPNYNDEHSIINDVEEFYEYFLGPYRKNIKNQKDVSNFLMRAGIDGIVVHNDVNDEILVVFNEDVITIV